MNLEPHEPLDAISLREATDFALAMLMDSPGQMRCDAGVEGAVRGSRQDIDAWLPIGMHSRSKEEGGSRLNAGMTFK